MTESPNKDRRVKISLPDYYKDTNVEVWEDLETYLFNGFLTASAFILNKTYVFKTLNHSEVRNLDFLRPLRSSPPQVRAAFRAAFIAHSVFLIDGENILYERPKHMARFTKIMHKIPQAVQEKIVENLSAINERASRLYPLTEVYAYENRSRFKWLQSGKVPIHSPSITGIPGTDNLGMNYIQQTWTALNIIMDKREEMEKDWAHAKFIGSCFNGKGVRAIDQKDKARTEKERSDRDDTKMKVLYKYLNRNAKDVPEGFASLPDGRPAEVVHKFQAISPEELRDQLEQSLSGEKDHHDLVVEAKQREFMQRSQELDRHRRNIYSAPVGIPPGRNTPGSSDFSGSRVIGSKSEVDAYIARMEELKLSGIQKSREISPGTVAPSDEKLK